VIPGLAMRAGVSGVVIEVFARLDDQAAGGIARWGECSPVFSIWAVGHVFVVSIRLLV